MGRDCRVVAVQLPVAGISIHAPRMGRDDDVNVHGVSFSNFNPRAPCGARPPMRSVLFFGMVNFNPRAPCGARRRKRLPQCELRVISIHAPHAGRDYYARGDIMPVAEFQSTRPMRGATGRFSCNLTTILFQSTRPMRGATYTNSEEATSNTKFQSTRPVWGATAAGRIDWRCV